MIVLTGNSHGIKNILKSEIYVYTKCLQCRDSKTEDLAINTDRWKLVVKRLAPDNTINISPVYEFFKIDSDPYEKADLSTQYPEKVKEFFKEIETFYEMKQKNQIPRYNENSNNGNIIYANWQVEKWNRIVSNFKSENI